MELVIFGQNIKVSYKKNLINNGVAGSYNTSTKEIEIDKSLKGKEFNQVLLHELIHAVFDRLGLINTNVSHELEEIICDNVATAISENAKLVWNKK